MVCMIQNDPAIYSIKGGDEMVYLLIILGIVFMETRIKNYMEKNKNLGDRQEILGGRIIIRKHYNRGMFLNYLEDKRELVKMISSGLLGFLILLFILVLPKKGKRMYKLGLSLVLGGAISNVSDRYNRGYVVDYFSFNCKKLKKIIFNLSDIFIFIGSFFIMLTSLFSKEIEDCAEDILS